MSKPNLKVKEAAYYGSETFKDYSGPMNSVMIVPADPTVLAALSKNQEELARKQGFVIAVNERYDEPGRFDAVASIAEAVGKHQAEGVQFAYGRDKSNGYIIGDLATGIAALGESGRFSGLIIELLNKELPKIEAHQKA